jgi:hypothetical protein
MQKISKADLISALAGAEKMRPAHPIAQRPAPTKSAELEQIFASFLRNSKFDVDKLEGLRTRSTADLQRFVEIAKAQAIKGSAKAKKAVRSDVASRLSAIKHLGRLAKQPALPTLITLDKPFLIWASPHSNILYDSHIEPYNSWAKINITSTASRQDKLSFYFLWENPSDYYAGINVSTSLALNGHCSAFANGSISYLWHVGGNTSSLYIQADFNPWQWWDQPPTLIHPGTKSVLSLVANAGFLDDTEAQSVSGVFDLSSNMLAIPPKGVMVFEVALSISCAIDDGNIDVNFNDSNFEIVCPSVAISLLTSPLTAAVKANRYLHAEAVR